MTANHTDDTGLSPHIAAISRATFLRRAGGAVLGAAALPGIAACGEDEEQSSDKAGSETAVSGTVKYLGWQGYDDKKAVKPLTERGVKVSPQYITTNDDIVTKLRGGAKGSLDIVTPFVAYVPALVTGDLLEELDYGRLPSAETYFPEFVDLVKRFGGGKAYCAPLVWGDAPMIVRPDRMPDLPESWLDLRQSKYRGKLTTLDDVYGSIIIISRALYGPDKADELSSAELNDVVKVWKEIKRNVVTFAPSYGDAADIMARGDAAGMIQGWRFMEQQLKAEGLKAVAHLPEEGTYSWCDTYAIPKEAPNQDAAYAFIETMISARGNALIGAVTGSGVANKAARARLPKDQFDLYPYDEIGSYLTRETGFYPLPLEPEGEYTSYEDWTKAWEQIKSA